jgi:hypothetical protein
MIKVSEFLSNNLNPFLSGAYIGRTIVEDGYIYTVSTFKKVKTVVDDEQNTRIYNQSREKYVDKLKKISEVDNSWFIKKIAPKSIKPKARCDYFHVLENDLKLTQKSFFNKLYRKIVSETEWMYEDSLTENKKRFISGFMELRGSIDTGRPYITQDYFYNSEFESRKISILMDYCNVPIDMMNINFRDLQPEFVNDINRRNTQFRINLKWYVNYIGLINEYKALIFENNYTYTEKYEKDSRFYFSNNITVNNYRDQVNQRLRFYTATIYDKILKKNEIDKLRSTLGFDKKSVSRNREIVEYIRLNTPDECDSCKGKYELEARTFISSKTGRPYFEIHHVISFGNNKELDDINNLSKLCPICHDNLKKGRGTEADQKEIILSILLNNDRNRDFCEHYFDESNIEILTNLIFESLK